MRVWDRGAGNIKRWAGINWVSMNAWVKIKLMTLKPLGDGTGCWCYHTKDISEASYWLFTHHHHHHSMNTHTHMQSQNPCFWMQLPNTDVSGYRFSQLVWLEVATVAGSKYCSRDKLSIIALLLGCEQQSSNSKVVGQYIPLEVLGTCFQMSLPRRTSSSSSWKISSALWLLLGSKPVLILFKKKVLKFLEIWKSSLTSWGWCHL